LQQWQQHTLPSPQYNALLLVVKFISVVKTTNKIEQFVFSFDLQLLVLSISHGVVNYDKGCSGHITIQTQQSPEIVTDNSHDSKNVVPNNTRELTNRYITKKCTYTIMYFTRN
jgi:hypothetical protein